MKSAWRFVLVLAGLISMESHAIDAAALFKKAAPSVVMVMAFDAAGQPKSIGSGVYVGTGKTVATNLHVIAGATSVKIKGSAGVVDIKFVVGIDEKRDLAILATDIAGPALLLSERVPDVGEEVVAVGNPKGLEGTVSTGIVSGVREYKDSVIFQVTTPISPGSSGGPIVDARGQVLALTTFFLEGGQSLNFAVPSSYIAKLLRSAKPQAISTMAGADGGKRMARAIDERVRVSDYGIDPHRVEYSLFNSTGLAIRNTRLVIVFYPRGASFECSGGDPLHYIYAKIPDLVPAGLAIRVTTRDEAIGYNTQWCAEFRILDYEVFEGTPTEGIPDFR